MKKIICYGDSNTYGFNPKNASRYDENTRWTAILQNIFADKYKVTEEGMCDRTGFVYNPKGMLYSAQMHFPQILSDIDENDILILAVGTNDLQFQYNISFDEIKTGLEKLISLAKEKTNTIIIIPSVILSGKILDGFFKIQFDESSIEKSKEVLKIYEQVAKNNNCFLFDINKYTNPSDLDGLHYDRNSHKQIAEKLAEFIDQVVIKF